MQEHPEAIATARWWASQLRLSRDSDDFGLRAAVEPGETEGIEVATTANPVFKRLRKAERDEACLTEERILAFERYLARSIGAHLKIHTYGCVIFNDWEPDGLLVEAAREAGFEVGLTLFPVKTGTITRIGQASVELSDGGSIWLRA